MISDSVKFADPIAIEPPPSDSEEDSEPVSSLSSPSVLSGSDPPEQAASARAPASVREVSRVRVVVMTGSSWVAGDSRG